MTAAGRSDGHAGVPQGTADERGAAVVAEVHPDTLTAMCQALVARGADDRTIAEAVRGAFS